MLTRLMRRARLAGPLLAAMCVFASPAAGAPLPPQMHTVAGGGSCTVSTPNPNPNLLVPLVLPCDGVAATSVPIANASSVAALPDGSFLYVDAIYNLVRQVSPSGQVTTVAGNGTTTDADGVPATASGLNGPVSVAPTPDGGFLITEYNGSVVRMVSPGAPGTATITTIAGTGTPGQGALTGLATSTALNYPSQAVPTADGGVLIADTGNDYIRLLSDTSATATISTIAGSVPGSGPCDDRTLSCEGLQAGAVALHHPVSVSPLQDGSGGYLIAEADNSGASAIREVSQMSTSGTFTTVAGTPGQPSGYGGDGGPATSALLGMPEQVLSTSDGGLLIADTNNERIRQVSPSGTINTIAGNGVASYAGDGGAATSASLDAPAGVSPTTHGGLLIADADSGAIREITIPPVSKITLSPAQPDGINGWYVSSTVQVKISSATGKSIRCVLDPTSAPPVYDALPSGPCAFTGGGAGITGEGAHTLYAASINAFGDKELPISVSFKIDSIRPTVTCNGTPIFPLGAPHAMVTATIADPGGSGPLPPVASAPADASATGPGQALVGGSDNAGNSLATVCPYTVLPPALRPAPVLKWAFAPKRSYSTVTELRVTRVAAGASVSVTCHGKGCPFSAKQGVGEQQCRGHACKARKPKPRAPSRTVDLQPLFAHTRLKVGIELTIRVTQAHLVGRAFVVRIQASKPPSYSASCLVPGSSTPGRGC